MDCYGEENLSCRFHPKEVVVGICAICLKERLLLLASKQNNHNNSKNKSFKILKKKPNITFDKVFALASFLLEFRHRNSGADHYGEDSAASLEDSFISIKFEDNGRALWDHKRNHKKESRTAGKGTKSAVVQKKPSGGRALRWKNRIGYLLQMPGKHHVSSSGNISRGWSLRMRRTTSTTIITKTG